MKSSYIVNQLTHQNYALLIRQSELVSTIYTLQQKIDHLIEKMAKKDQTLKILMERYDVPTYSSFLQTESIISLSDNIDLNSETRS